ncbi:CRISPR-associated endonuclease Cas2 [Caldivirga sp.]|uniref:CRISPR-associated endonuclease Cas2 n=1 Tax=Caldivirga sp. TaxID=2080243 RepID=UPI003D0A5215
MIIIASYDISDDRRRVNAMNTLKALGFTRVQRSLYIAKGGLSLAKDAARALSRVIKASEDSVIIVIIDNRTWASGFRLGNLNDQVEDSVMVI